MNHPVVIVCFVCLCLCLGMAGIQYAENEEKLIPVASDTSSYYPIYTFEYLADTVNNVCIAIAKDQMRSFGATSIDCIMVPAGQMKVIEESKYVYK